MPFKEKEKLRAFQLSWIKKRREQWIQENGPCALCGSEEGLECHHLDPLSKISHRIWSWSALRRNRELEKCRVLCGECHKAETAKYRKISVKHGTTTKYKNHRCRCQKCCQAMSYYRKNRTTFVPKAVPEQMPLFVSY